MTNSWNTSWTPEREAKLKVLWATDLSASEIGIALGGFSSHHRNGASAVIGKAHRLNLPSRKKSVWNSELLLALKRCISEDLSGGVAAAKLGLTRNQVMGKAFRLGRGFHSMTTAQRKPRMATDRRRNANGTSVQHIKLRKTGEFFVEQSVSTRTISIPQGEYLGKSLMELEAGQCRYIAGDNALFCAQPVQEDSSYCRHHHALCHTPSTRIVTPYVNWVTK